MNNEIDIIELKQDLNNLQIKLQPYQRLITYISISILLLLLFAAGFGLGAERVCRQVDGFLDSKAYCHLDYYNQKPQQKFNDFEMPMLELPK